MSPQNAVLAAALSCLVCPVLSAQQQQNAGFGSTKRAFNATENSTRHDSDLAGVAFLNGQIFAPGSGAGSSARVYIFDPQGTFVRRPRDPSLALGATRIRDLTHDDTATLLGATDVGIVAFGEDGKLTTTVLAQNGPQTIVNPIGGPALDQLEEYRAVAYDASGNGGNGSLFVGDTGDTQPIYEIDLSGNVLNTYLNDDGLGNQLWNCYGLALDTMTGMLWCNSGPPNSTDRYRRIIELDPGNNLMPTGVSFQQYRFAQRPGGLARVDRGYPGTDPSRFDLIAVNRLNGEDWIVVHRVHLIDGLHGKDEAFLEGRVNNQPFTTGKLNTPGDAGTLDAGDRFGWRLQPGTGNANGAAAICFLNIGRNALVDGTTVLPLFGNPVLAELRAQWVLSQPASPAGLMVNASVGGPTTQVTIPPEIARCFDLLKVQCMYLDLRVPRFPPLIATNELWANFADEASCNVVIEANGPNSENPGMLNPSFFQIHHKGGPGITEVKFSFKDSNNINLRALGLFDIDDPLGGQPNGLFHAGGAFTPTCRGTYRNTDRAVGLVYDALNDPPSPCVPTGNSGFISSDGTNNGNGWNSGFNQRELTFRFTSFSGGTASTPVSFMFDCDTDGLNPNSAYGGPWTGADHAGLVVYVTFDNGQTLGTELRADARNRERAVGGM